MAQADEATFVRVRFQPILDSLQRETLDDEDIKQILRHATAEGTRVPSIETFLHAMCLQLEGVRFVGHTHPTAAVSLLSSSRSRELFAGALVSRPDCRARPSAGLRPVRRSRSAAGPRRAGWPARSSWPVSNVCRGSSCWKTTA